MFNTIQRIALLSAVAAVFTTTTTVVDAKYVDTFGWAGKHGHVLECKKNGFKKNGFITGACTSGKKTDCLNKTRKAGIQCNNGDGTGATDHDPGFGDAGGIGKGFKKSKNFALCPTGEFAFARCSSGKHPDCKYKGKKHSNVLYCKKFEGMEYDTSEDFKTLCGGVGERVECPAGYAVIGSCGAGEKGSDCAYGDCKNRGHVFTQIRCQKIRYVATE